MLDAETTATRKSDLRALLSLINKSAEEAIAAYDKTGYDIPSLDAPSDYPADSIELKKAMRLLDGACTQLCSTLAPPTYTIFTRAMSALELASLRVAVEAKVADILEAHPEGLHVNEIGAKTNIDGGKLARTLRCLSARHVFREVSADTFANNRLSLYIRSHAPMASLVLMQSDELNKYALSWLYEALTDPTYGKSYDQKHTAFCYGIRNELPDSSLFDWYTQHPEYSERFGRAMVAMASVTDANMIVGQYPWHTLPAGSTVCDVGGGVGSVLIKIASHHPHLHLTLQDLPNVIEQARGFWTNEYPKAAEEGRIDFVPIDFFADAPVQGRDIYHIRQVLHDWPDADCVKILKNIRKAMGPNSRLLINEFILQPTTRSEGLSDFVNLAPRPLLPNFGEGSIRKYLQDVNMMAVLNAKERTVDELCVLGRQAGLELVRFWDFVDTGLVEMKASE
ncbi:S-adenosyl-L-methionine-dependent methyltransferase [Dentipellis sp. KUC8613]|nr:S-adenosyl-L-methionine-dependent methyltransferase [Dentipellis sp. KUC8613]